MCTKLIRCLMVFVATNLLCLQAQAEQILIQNDLLFPTLQPSNSEELENERGREGIDISTLNNQNIRATLSNNIATNNVNGYNIIDHGSFTQASGITSVIQNSGNNVIIQDSTIVNVTITP